MSGKKSLHDKLEAAKGKSAIKEFDVTITENLQIKVTVEAKSREEAKQTASDNWKNGDYIIDDQHFIGVKFEAAPTKSEHSRGGER